ncbi:hypothetical protein [Kitasatospora sp. MBT63]|uniref:hypothetical protein n=1 Tax=Kitasatospora sp. MBT63 TaxID=1444768 RepID=UPI0011EA6138|nr:hypothetical protein [Kitasatospora sp. MBT63]
MGQLGDQSDEHQVVEQLKPPDTPVLDHAVSKPSPPARRTRPAGPNAVFDICAQVGAFAQGTCSGSRTQWSTRSRGRSPGMAGWLDPETADRQALDRDLALLSSRTNACLDFATCLSDQEAVTAFADFCLYGPTYDPLPKTDAGQNPSIAEAALLAYCCATAETADVQAVLRDHRATWGLDPEKNTLVGQALAAAREAAGDGLSEADLLRAALEGVLEAYHEDFVEDVLAHHTASRDTEPEPPLYAFHLDLETARGRQELGGRWYTREEALELLGIGGMAGPAAALNAVDRPGTVNGIKIGSVDGATTVRAVLSRESVRVMNDGTLLPGSSAYVLGGSVLLTAVPGRPEGRLAVRLAEDLGALWTVSLVSGWGGVRIAEDLPQEVLEQLAEFLPPGAKPRRQQVPGEKKGPSRSSRDRLWRPLPDGSWASSAPGGEAWRPEPGPPADDGARVVLDDGSTRPWRAHRRALAAEQIGLSNPTVLPQLGYGETLYGIPLPWINLRRLLRDHGFDAAQARRRLAEKWEENPGSTERTERIIPEDPLLELALQMRVDMSSEVRVEWRFMVGGSPVLMRTANEHRIDGLRQNTGRKLRLIEFEATLVIDPSEQQRRAMELAAALKGQGARVRTGTIRSARTTVGRRTYISAAMDDRLGPSQELAARVAARGLTLRSAADT